MKKTMRLIGIAAVVAVIVFAFAACANEPSDKAQTMTYSGSDSGGSYTLTITQDPSNRAFTPKTGDAYALSSGGKVSNGTVKNYSAAAIELIAAIGSAEFTVNISSAGITGFTGASSLNWDDGTPALLPSSVTPGKGGNTAVTFSSVSANGNASQTTTQLTLTFSAAVTGLSASDITLSGISGVTKGTLTGSGSAYTLSISGFTAGGTLSVAVAKTGYNISGSPKQTTIYYSSTNNPEPSEPTEPTDPPAGTPGLNYVLINNNTAYEVLAGTAYSGDVVIPAEHNGLPVTAIGDQAFASCGSLTSITIPNSVTSIGESAFKSCSSLTSITIPDSVTSIGSYAFENCTGLTSVTIPAGVTSIHAAFWDCSSLESVTIPDSVTSIGALAFSNCSSLTSITIPDSVTSIGDSAFSSCSGLTSITIPNSVTSIGTYAFAGCSGLSSITIPNSVTSISHQAFSGCTSLTSVTLGSGVTSTGDATFFSCTSLTSITIPNSVTSIDSQAFYNCSGLTSITIPSSVTSIDSYAFGNCSSLTSVTINGTITSANFSSSNSFPGDLRNKYLAGSIGTYTRSSGSDTWTKQP